MICAFIDSMREQGYAVESVCRVMRELGLKIAARSYRVWKQPGRPVADRTVTDAQVVDMVRDIAWTVDHTGKRKMTPEGLYGRRKMLALIRRTSPGVTRGAVDRAMKLLSLVGVRRSKAIRTTVPGKDGKRAGDLLNRDFSTHAPNRKWVTDFTYCRTWAGWVYVAFITDCFADKIVGWHASTCMDTELVMVPLKIALWQRDREGHPHRPGELICHSDAGSQYTSIRFSEHLEAEGISPSIGTVADAYDNALAESINGLYKTECLRTTIFHDGPFKTIADIEYATAGWVDWYNNRRLHSSLNYQSPAECEAAYHAAVNRQLQPA